MASNEQSDAVDVLGDPVTQQLTCDSKIYRHTKKKDGSVHVEEQPNAFVSPTEPKDDADAPFALVIRRYFSEKREIESVTVRINSLLLLKAFREVIKSYPTVATDFTKSVKLKSPFQMLFHHWDHLESYRDETDSPHMRQHLNLLLRFMEQEMGGDRKDIQSMLQAQMITFKRAWVIYCPGELAYTEIMEKPWLVRVEKVSYEESRNSGPYLTVHAKYCDANDAKTGEAHTRFDVFQKEHFASDHPANINTLPIYPRKFLCQDQCLEEELLARGKKFVANRGILTRDYDGLAQYLKKPPLTFFHPKMAEFSAVWLPFTESGRIVLDRKMFEEDNFNIGTTVQEIENPELMLCPPYLVGYSMDRKEWCRYLVDNVENVVWKNDAWSSLILEQEQKSVLKALVMSHKYPENARNQPEQKSKGLVVLLHGAPGSGKTLTAEAAAEMSEKALLYTSVGELNRYNSPSLFHHSLQRLLQYATTWKAIVLFDEADVFLETRGSNSGNTDRNALVAVFLKQLEYFSGIVMLTTNRLSSIDTAMMSRIHLSLHFASPGIDTRRSIWRQYLGAVPLDDTEISGREASDKAVEGLIRHDMNGREIFNALNTARTLARFENAKLSTLHIERVLKVRRTFEEHLQTAINLDAPDGNHPDR